MLRLSLALLVTFIFVALAVFNLTVQAGNVITVPGVTNLDDISDVSAASPSDKQLLRYSSDSSTWAAATENIDDLADVSATTPSNNNILKFNSSTSTWDAGAPSMTWSQVDKSTSSIADITTRSHTALSDIGTNTHASIDSALTAASNHASNTSNPHTVTRNQLAIDVEHLSGFMEAPTDKTYVLIQNAPYSSTVNTLTADLASGTITCKLTIDGVDVTGIDGLAISSTESTATATAKNAIAEGNTLSMVCSSNSSAADMGFTVKLTR